METAKFSTVGNELIGRENEKETDGEQPAAHTGRQILYKLSYKTHTNLHCSLQFLLTQFGRRNQSLPSIITLTEALTDLFISAPVCF